MQIEPNKEECPVCGYEFPSNPPIIKWAAVILILIFLLYFML